MGRTVFFSCQFDRFGIFDYKSFKSINQGALSLVPLKCLRIQERQ